MSEYPRPLNPAESAELRRRQSGKNRVMLVILFLLAVLFYAIAIVKFKVT